MINDTGQKLLIITENDGEILFSVEKGETLNIRSVRQTNNDKFYSPMIEINKGKRFIKTMVIEEKNVIKKLKDFPSVYMALNIMKEYLVKNYNVLLKADGKKYKINDLAEEIGVSRQMASRYIKKLKELNIVAEIDTNKGKVLAINPSIYFNGSEIPQRVYDIFNKKR
ncbi:MAG: HTH domain-containing protein [Spirochaetia bacterium]|nr:HTH domain-containing protein [Spirochaetia bacterium]